MTKSTQLSARSPENLYTILCKWQTILRIAHWRVRLSAKRPSPENLMECVTNHKRQIASIRIADKAWEESSTEFERLVIHELLHVVFNELDNEYHKQADRLPPNLYNEYIQRYDEKLEQLVESLAVSFYDQQSKP